MASVEMCGRDHNLKSSCDDLYLGRLRTHAIMAITIFKFEVCAFFLWKKKKYHGKPRYVCFTFIKPEVECTSV